MHISGTLLSMATVQFEDPVIEQLKNSVIKAREEQIDQALDMMVDEIFNDFAANDNG